jgi:Mitochondrial degradasome RNA helicase subunit C terminal
VQYFECYLWLNQRFSSAFVDSERALQESKHCAGLAEKALKAFADTAASTPTERKARNKAVLQVDRIFQSSEDVLTRSGKPKIETIYRRERSGSASDRRK